MGFFDFFRKKEVVDLTDNSQEDEDNDSYNGQVSEQRDKGDSSNNPEEKKKRLAKRIADMGGKIDDLSTQVYHLQQRIEVLEKKLGSNAESEME